MLDPTPPRMHRSVKKRHDRLRGVVWFFVFLMVLGLVAAPLGWFWRSVGAAGVQTPVTFTIPQGSTGNDVADLLEDKGIIRSAFAFRLLARLRGVALDSYEAGNYRLSTNMSAGEALDSLKKGPLIVHGIPVGFPEGYRVEQVADRVNEALGVRTRAFIKAAESGTYSLPPWLPEDAKTVEGFLFPSTYEFPKDQKITSDQVIQRLLVQFEAEVKDLPWDNADNLGVSPYQVVVIAAMVEREARFAEDRSKIAAVIYNRLENGMALQIDATVQYALGDWDPILVTDRQIDSPYNTYLHTGLPPTPIASPGLDSIRAALQPADADYLYYVVTDAAGHHEFTDSYEEFLRLQDKYQG
jgi:UPF0755 protein